MNEFRLTAAGYVFQMKGKYMTRTIFIMDFHKS